MRILGISGSPRRAGNTDMAIKHALEVLKDVGNIMFMRIQDYNIQHCEGCRECMQIMKCAIEGDDFEDVFYEWKKSDFLLVGVPVYWYCPPGVMKDFMDRSHGEYAHEIGPFKDKKAALISVGAEGGFETHEKILDVWLSHYSAQVMGKLRLYAREMDDLLNNNGELQKLTEFVKGLKKELK